MWTALLLLVASLGVCQESVSAASNPAHEGVHHHHLIVPAQKAATHGSQLELLIQRGRKVAPRPLVLCMASKSYMSPLFNVAESIRRTGGSDAIATLSVVVLDSELIKILPPSLETVSFAVLSKELGMCDTNTTASCDGASLDPNKMGESLKNTTGESDGDVNVSTAPGVNPRANAYQHLWSFRIKLLLHLLDHGIGVVMNDLDALWMHDPWVHRFKDMPEYDLLASRGEYPKRYGHKKAWGSAVCMGFVFFRGTQATKQFVDLAYEAQSYVDDDQVWINRALDRQGILFPRLQPGAVDYKKMDSRKRDDLYTGQLHVVNENGENLTFTVGMLPPQEVMRRCKSGKKNITIPDDALVEHCHVTKSGSGQRAFMKKQRMLHARRTWYLLKDYGESLQTCLETKLNPTSSGYQKPTDYVAAWMILLDSVRDKFKVMTRPQSAFG